MSQDTMINNYLNNIKNDCGFFNPHKWSKWTQFQIECAKMNDETGKFSERYFKTFQKRNCLKCNKEQRGIV